MTSLSSNVTENPNVLPLDGLSIATFKSKEQLSSGKYERSPEWSSQGNWKYIDETLFWDKNGNGLRVLIAKSEYSTSFQVIRKHRYIPSCKEIAFSEIKAIGLKEAKQEFPDINPELYSQTKPVVNDEDLVGDRGEENMSSNSEGEPKPKRKKTDNSVNGSNRIDPFFAMAALSDKKVMEAYPGMASILNGSGCCPGGCTPDDSSYSNRKFCKTCGFSVF